MAEWWHFCAHLDEPTELTLVVSVLKATPRRLEALSAALAIVVEIDRSTQKHRVAWFASPLARGYAEGADGGFRFNFGRLSKGRVAVGGHLGRYALGIVSPARAISLSMSQDAPTQLFGDQGVMRYGPRAELAYYAHTQLSISGEVDHRPAKGAGWMEHQWGDTRVRDFSWRYLAAHLDSGEQVIAFRAIHRSTGVSTRYGALIDASGMVHPLDDVRLMPRGRSVFRGVPGGTLARADGLELEIDPLFDNQRVRTGISRWIIPEYWEGVSSVRGTIGGRTVRGIAMTEIV
jgi:predicted secreted hydrolase